MTVREAKEIAKKWVDEDACKLPGFQGAFFGGSVNWKPDEEPFPIHSDLDISLVIDGDTGIFKQRKILYQGVILEPSPKSVERVKTAEQVLGDFRLACHFSVPSIIADPTGHLSEIHRIVSNEYARREVGTDMM